MTTEQYIHLCQGILTAKTTMLAAGFHANKIEMKGSTIKDLEDYCNSTIKGMRQDHLKHTTRFAGLEVIENDLIPEGEFIIK